MRNRLVGTLSPSLSLYSLLLPLVLWLPLPSSVCLSISVSSPILAMMSRQKAIKYRFISLAARCLPKRGRRGALQRGKDGGASRRDSTTNTSHVHLPNESTRAGARELPFDLILNEKHQLELRLAISRGGREVSQGGGKVGAFSMQLNILQPLDLPPTLVLVLYGSVGLRGSRDTTSSPVQQQQRQRQQNLCI